jgi:tryptophan 2,3-dioxygenase
MSIIQRGDSYDLDPSQQEAVHYGSYLKLDHILNGQVLLSEKILGKQAHDEHLFIVIHQVFELWFKQIIFEVDSIREIMSAPVVDERNMLVVSSRLGRVIEILKIMISQIGVLETMTPMDFREFRDILAPASGFQSTQFRILEISLGVREGDRVSYGKYNFKDALKEEERAAIEAAEKRPSLVDVINGWLERTPGLDEGGFNFWKRYQEAYEKMVLELKDKIDIRAGNSAAKRLSLEKDYAQQKETCDCLFSEQYHKELMERGERRLTYKGLQGALEIFIYREEPRFHQPYRLLSQLMDVDALVTRWRYTHVTMVQRMIGNRVGTGGSSGYQYLRATTGWVWLAFEWV